MIKFEQTAPIPGIELKHVSSEELLVFHIHKAFGKFPLELGAENLERLEGMAACYAEPNPIRILIQAVNRFGSIRVWREKHEN